MTDRTAAKPIPVSVMISRRHSLAGMVALLSSPTISLRAFAQSEFLRGDRMPYDAFDRLPKTDVDVAAGIIHVGFAPGDLALPRAAVLDWIRTSAKAWRPTTAAFPSVR